MGEVYCPGQVANVFPWVQPGVRWFLLGGPADGDEGQVFRRHYPAARVIGFEPNPHLAAVQRARGFPGPLLEVALWGTPGTMTLWVPHEGRQGDRSASAVKYSGGHRGHDVPTTTLDQLSVQYGPFTEAVLWLDIEGAELEALKGAAGLLASGAVSVVNVEVFMDQEAAVEALLAGHGFREVHRWGEQQNGERRWWNAVYVRDAHA